MKYRKLLQTDLKVSEISLGCWTLGGLNWVEGHSAGWANVDEKEAVRTIHMAVEAGVNHFDNADVYGNGHAERLLAKALGAKSKDVILATKIGYFRGTAVHPYDPLHIRHQCEQSLKNLNRDVIDIYYFHNARFGYRDQFLDDAVEEMNRLKEEGKIRVIGQSDWSADAICRVVPKTRPQVIQSWASALDDHNLRKGSPLRKILDEQQISYVAFSPLAQGLLLGKYHAQNPPKFKEGDHRKYSEKFSVESLRKVESKLEKLKSRFGETSKELARMALQYLLYDQQVACVIPGFRNEQQVSDILYAVGQLLSDEDILFIRDIFQ